MESLKNRKQFKFYRSYFDIISELENDTDKLNYLLSILEFQFNGIELPLKGMAKFAFKSQKHSLDRQLKGFIDATSSETPLDTPIDTPLRGADTMPIEHTPIAIINNKEEIIKNKELTLTEKEEIKFNFKSELISYGFIPNLVNDWLIVRKNKKASNTKTAFESFISQIEKSNVDKNEILKICISNDWKGFNVDWIKDKDLSKNNTSTNTYSANDVRNPDYRPKL